MNPLYYGVRWGQINNLFILDIIGLRRASIHLLAKQTESKVKDKRPVAQTDFMLRQAQHERKVI